ncbi:ComF/GntX-like protein [Actibacterium atlanticum]|uniref:ComF/GntX-like protein n=1 Tax=Actibacterium atlanticum TaxID=1461693 RepID=A0A058ZNU5_9RHOB|nr:ComF family protein [Actibacterium atlanticum]KCV82501.1 ComF/GntX-like protein [Actibacterium atlanticum]
MGMQSALHAIFPPQCIGCGELVDRDFALCGTCWREAHFITGLVCDSCGVPLPGDGDGSVEQCDDCLKTARPWTRGRAAVMYEGTGRKLVLSLKHGDRAELARPAASWMAQAGAPLKLDGMIVAPVPLHRWRLLKRRYNQSALLAQGVADAMGLVHCPDLLMRVRATETQDGKGVDQRFANIAQAIRMSPRQMHRVEGKPVLLIDDVMTSGATLSACAEACMAVGAASVSTLVLARVAKLP